jgi:hypothetical protein
VKRDKELAMKGVVGISLQGRDDEHILYEQIRDPDLEKKQQQQMREQHVGHHVKETRGSRIRFWSASAHVDRRRQIC